MKIKDILVRMINEVMITNKKTFVEDIRKHLNNIPKEYYIKAIKNGDNKI